jgi:hypothetical protein
MTVQIIFETLGAMCLGGICGWVFGWSIGKLLQEWR